LFCRINWTPAQNPRVKCDLCTVKTSDNAGLSGEGATDGLLTKRGLAPKHQISTRTLDDWMRRGRVPFLKLGKTVRFRLSDVIEKLNEFRVH
jgi:hypothetical protein